jgi:hypothetical protein
MLDVIDAAQSGRPLVTRTVVLPDPPEPMTPTQIARLRNEESGLVPLTNRSNREDGPMEENPEEADALRRLMDAFLLEQKGAFGPSSNVIVDIERRAKENGIDYDDRRDARVLVEYWWHLARLGALAIPGDSSLGRPHCWLTERGRQLLERGEHSPHDPSKYMETVKSRVSAADPVAMAYLDESVGAWTSGLYRASAVMLGCACERLVLMLAEAIVDAGLAPGASQIRKLLDQPVSRASRIFEHIRKSLAQLGAKEKLPGKLADALDRKLSPISEYARGLRNASGHPTGVEVSSEDAEAGLLLFPGFYSLVDEIIDHLGSVKKGGTPS